MNKKNKVKLITQGEDYYTKLKEKTDKIAEKIYSNNDDIFKARLYNLTLNMCNQLVYDYTYIFTKEDLFFVSDYNINIQEIIYECREEVIKLKKRETKLNKKKC